MLIFQSITFTDIQWLEPTAAANVGHSISTVASHTKNVHVPVM